MTGKFPETGPAGPAVNRKFSGASRVRLEAGTRHVLAWCASCPPWRAVRGDLAGGHLAAATHAELVHGDAAAAKEHRRRARDTQNGG